MKTFEELGVNPHLRKAIEEMGFEAPMPVQEAVIPELLGEGKDIIALAQTGTGKTAAFGLPLIQNIDTRFSHAQALIMAPTRELCVQIARELESYAKYIKGVEVVAVYGGASIETQIKQIKQAGSLIIVATPGRLLDLMRRRVVDLSKIKDVVLDEADEMLTMGFSESIDDILSKVPQERHLLLFSATMSDDIKRITKKYMSDPMEVVIGRQNMSNVNIRHQYYMVHAKDKYAALKRIVDYYPGMYGIVFCRTRRDTQEIADKLIQDGYNADALHGDLSQQQRDYVMQRFRIRHLKLLVATDVAARGLDVDDLTHVINFSLPDDPEIYTHRSGRTARAGKSGMSISICHVREQRKMRDITRVSGVEFEKATLPDGKEICEKQLYNFVDRLEKTVPDEEKIAPYLNGIQGRLSWLSKDELIKRMIFMEFERLIHYYEVNEDLSEVEENAKNDRKQSDREDVSRAKRQRKKSDKGAFSAKDSDVTTLRLNFGKREGIFPNTLIDIVSHCMSSRIKIGKIDIHPHYTYFEVESRLAQEVAAEMSNFDLQGAPIHVTIPKGKNKK